MDIIRFCIASGCTRLARNSQRCELHKGLPDQQRIRPQLDAWYDKAIWRKKLRPMKLRRSPMCEICGTAPATDVHHIDGSWKITRDWRLFVDLDNMQSLCHPCHSRETMKENINQGVMNER